MRAVVTGAAGFIGSRLARRLIAEGVDVVGYDDLSEGRPENLADAPEVGLVVASINDAERLLEAGRGADVIFHQAGFRSVPRSIEQPQLTTRSNVVGTLNVLTTAKEVGASVVAASSSSVYGDQETFPVTEEVALRPRSPYAASKVALEAYCRAWSPSFGVPTVCLRYFNVYGPFQPADSDYAAVIPKFIHACLSGDPPVVHGDGEQARDFTFIDDVVDANLLAWRAARSVAGMVFNIAGGRTPTTINRLLSIIAESTGTTPSPVTTEPRAGDIRRSEADVSLARRLLGYDPSTAVPDGVAATVAWFRGRGADRR
jgi:nucleoside-diphosphate-sugar epimerase